MGLRTGMRCGDEGKPSFSRIWSDPFSGLYRASRRRPRSPGQVLFGTTVISCAEMRRLLWTRSFIEMCRIWSLVGSRDRASGPLRQFLVFGSPLPGAIGAHHILIPVILIPVLMCSSRRSDIRAADVSVLNGCPQRRASDAVLCKRSLRAARRPAKMF